jgi:predicted component of type VI protein secretion system
MNRLHNHDQEAWQMFQKKLNDMRSKPNNDFERLVFKNMHNH